MLIVYCDGSCLGNPGRGGWGAIISINDQEFEIYGGEKLTTNNRMELMAAIEALSFIEDINQPITMYTDSQYVIKGITEWIKGWKAKNFKNVKNVDLWKILDQKVTGLNITWNWVKGHAGNVMNERVDVLAKKGAYES